MGHSFGNLSSLLGPEVTWTLKGTAPRRQTFFKRMAVLFNVEGVECLSQKNRPLSY